MKLSPSVLFLVVATCGDCSGGTTGGSSGGGETSTGTFSCDDYRIMLDVEVRLARECTDHSECDQVIDGTGCGCATDDLVANGDFELDYFYDLLDEATAAGCSVDFGTSCDCPATTETVCAAGACAWR